MNCPVCGFRLAAGLHDHQICPSCGTEFGYDDAGVTHAQLRRRWLDAGAPWFSDYTQAPTDWNPETQVMRVMDITPRTQGTNATRTVLTRLRPITVGGGRRVQPGFTEYQVRL